MASSWEVQAHPARTRLKVKQTERNTSGVMGYELAGWTCKRFVLFRIAVRELTQNDSTKSATPELHRQKQPPAATRTPKRCPLTLSTSSTGRPWLLVRASARPSHSRHVTLTSKIRAGDPLIAGPAEQAMVNLRPNRQVFSGNSRCPRSASECAWVS
jgi:hypothetical protein